MRSTGRVNMGGDLTDWGLGALAALMAFGGLLWLGAAAASVVTGRRVPTGGVLSALTALTRSTEPRVAWEDPSQVPGAVAYWGVTSVVLASSAALLLAGLRLRQWLSRSTRTDRIRSLPGMATAAEAMDAAGRSSLVRRAGIVRPSLAATPPRSRIKVDPRKVGYRLGRVRGRELWCSAEDSALLVGPPRMGKGLHVVIPWVLDAPGPVVALSLIHI